MVKKKRTQKERRHSGRVTPRIDFHGMNKTQIIENCLEPKEHWSDWDDYRDGFRGCDDRKMLRNPNMSGAAYLEVKKWNKKLKKLIARRKIYK